MNIFLSCTKEKADKRCKAKDMYMPSSLYSKSYEYAKSLNPDKMYILSAKHHLLPLNKEIEPYNETLNDATVDERKAWAEETYKQMKAAHIDFNAKTYFFCGENYLEFLKDYFPNSESVYDGKAIGEIMHWLDGKLKKTNENKTYTMKGLSNYLNEARQVEYRVAVNSVQDSEGLPVTVTMLVDKNNQKAFEKWLEDQEDNEFSHAEGGNVEY
jgi:hypothetical protein